METNNDTRITTYLSFTIWPILNDDNESVVDYYDIHAPGCTTSDGIVIESFGTRAECSQWIRKEARAAKLDRAYLGYDRYERFK